MTRSDQKEFLISSDLTRVQEASGQVLGFLRPLALDEGIVFDIRLCFEEALINAIKYGNRQQRELDVRVSVAYDPAEVRIAVEDQGSGFEPGKLPDCTKGKRLVAQGGRGVHLICQLMDQVRYNERGNRLEMVKRIKHTGAGPAAGQAQETR